MSGMPKPLTVVEAGQQIRSLLWDMAAALLADLPRCSQLSDRAALKSTAAFATAVEARGCITGHSAAHAAYFDFTEENP